jgi:dienelactone hydrolase
VYYPTSVAGRVGAIAIVPGHLALQSTIAWYGPLLALEGFIVLTIDTSSIYDSPASRATQLLAALDYLATSSPVAANVDSNRLAVMGWSMGGGASLQASLLRPALKAAIPLAPWDTTTDFSADSVPTLIVACQSDAVAPVASYALPFYASIPAGTSKAYLEIASGMHDCITRRDATIAQFVVGWLKRFVNGDTVAAAGLCPGPSVGGAISAYQATCPF